MGSVNSARKAALEEMEFQLDFEIPTFHKPTVVQKEILIQGFPQVVDGRLVFQMRSTDVFKSVRDMLNVGSEYSQMYAIVSSITSKVIENTTGCDISIRIDTPFDLQDDASWVESDIDFEDAKEQKQAEEKKEEEEDEAVEKSDEEGEEGGKQKARERFNNRVYGGEWNSNMDPNDTVKKSVTVWIPANPSGKENLIYKGGVDMKTLLSVFGLTEASLCQVSWDKNGDTVSYSKDHYMASWFKNKENQASMSMASRQIVEEGDLVKIPTEFYQKANVVMMSEIINKLHYTQFRQPGVVYIPADPEKELELIKKIQDAYAEGGENYVKIQKAAIKYNVIVKLVVSAVIGSKSSGSKKMSTKDGPVWI